MPRANQKEGVMATRETDPLRSCSTQVLLRTAYRLTHEMHDLPEERRAEKRQMRDLIDEEIVRRAGRVEEGGAEE